jgi:2-oxoacid:acceptor oxidoreductase delta subunit (pyruvate/2-ketoisovalerate family)
MVWSQDTELLASTQTQADGSREDARQAQVLKPQQQGMINPRSAIIRGIAEIDATKPNLPMPITASDESGHFRKMTAVIDQERCMNCGLCIDLCPEQAIDMSPNYTVVIDSSKCTGCGSCADDCPVEAISMRDAASGAISRKAAPW